MAGLLKFALLSSAAASTPAGGGGGGGSITPGTAVNLSSTSAQTTQYQWTSVDLGAEDATRKVWLAVSMVFTSGSGNDITGVQIIEGVNTYNGTAVQVDTTGSNQLELWEIDVPTGSGANFTVNVNFTVTSGNAINCGVVLLPFAGSTASAYATRAAAGTETAAAATSITSTSQTVPSGALAFMAAKVNNGAPGAITWTATDGTPTEITDVSIGTNNYLGAAHHSTAGAQSFTATWTNSVTSRIVAASWGAS